MRVQELGCMTMQADLALGDVFDVTQPAGFLQLGGRCPYMRSAVNNVM